MEGLHCNALCRREPLSGAMQSAGEYALKRVFLFVFKRALGRLVEQQELDLVAVRSSSRERVHISHAAAPMLP